MKIIRSKLNSLQNAHKKNPFLHPPTETKIFTKMIF